MFIKIDANFSPLSKQRKFNQCYFHEFELKLDNFWSYFFAKIVSMF
jgi:hypothetical protein